MSFGDSTVRLARIRTAVASDAQEITALLLAEQLCNERGASARVDAVLARAADLCFVAVVDGRIVGAILAFFNGFHVFASHLVIARAHQRTGLGTALHERVVERGRALGAIGVIADARLSVTAFCHRLGYRLPGAVFLIRDL